MKNIEWLSDKQFSVDGVKFLNCLDDYSLKTDDDRVVILKDRNVLDNYEEVFGESPPKTMLEFGIFQGGSPTLFSLWFELDKFVGIDICPPVEKFDSFCAQHSVGSKIKSYYGVSQIDKQRVTQIICEEFGNTPLDVIIDDASHLYGLTRRTFEIAFPYLRPGGMYVVEDWGWAHWPGSKFFMGETSMSILIMELMMLCASRSDIISEVRVFPSFAFIRKSPLAPAMDDMSLGSLYNKRGLEITGADGANLSSVITKSLREIKTPKKSRHGRLAKLLGYMK